MHRKKLYISLVISIIAIGILIVSVNNIQDDVNEVEKEVTPTTSQPAINEQLVLEVTLQKQYVDGKIEQETHEESIGAMEDFWATYEDWQLIEQSSGEMTFRKQVDDISPYLKANGYFGLQEGMLSIFEGAPLHQQVIQSFYQIDTSTLESFQIEELESGIKIESIETYHKILEVYRDLSPTKQVQG
ncbi:BofC C-terminal domain-containing protein [Paraliobacillus sediminis]|uniref:BofC C-terminal domain-containing protein n=1 Tax=Paraliobacillus sediminis TaxID=1885916 RepID=UPI0013C31E51|nr:BofC C-terminal domain-containing protein [Paraliobacillus sediminis]